MLLKHKAYADLNEYLSPSYMLLLRSMLLVVKFLSKWYSVLMKIVNIETQMSLNLYKYPYQQKQR
jgi:hypothetical protein